MLALALPLDACAALRLLETVRALDGVRVDRGRLPDAPGLAGCLRHAGSLVWKTSSGVGGALRLRAFGHTEPGWVTWLSRL